MFGINYRQILTNMRRFVAVASRAVVSRYFHASGAKPRYRTAVG